MGNVVRRSADGVGLEWAQAASNAVLYSQFGSVYRDRAEFTRPDMGVCGGGTGLYYYQFDFQD
jgi:hypothetical protein